MQENNQENENLKQSEDNSSEENIQQEQSSKEEQQVPKEETLEDKIAVLEAKSADLNDKLLRTLAEIDNVRRRSREEVLKASKFGLSSFASDLVVVAENFFLATDNAPLEEIEKSPAIKNFSDAVSMTKKELMKVLEKNHIKRIYPLNEKFDHNFHEAIAQIENPEGSEAESGDVVQVIQAGYSIADRLIRPALVGVAK